LPRLTPAALAPLLATLALACAACQAESPPRGPEEVCARACSAKATHCSRHECARGCNLVIDRLAENEGDTVLACVGAVRDRCDDRTWAACAVRLGPHADGGPPAPPPPPSDIDAVEE
jgi:hypothetical protein